MQAHVQRGLARHFDDFSRRQDAGARRLGFKVAFNAPAVQRALQLPYSLVAGLTHDTCIDGSQPYSLADLVRPALEGEVAVWLAEDLSPDFDRDRAAAAIACWAPAIELVDFDRGFDELEVILAEGVFHRALALGAPVQPPVAAQLRGCRTRITHGETRCEVDAGEATGDAAEVLLHLARVLEPFGQRLRAGDLVILGAMNPLCPAQAGQRFEVVIESLGELGLKLEA